jgi:hypothetical protein
MLALLATAAFLVAWFAFVSQEALRSVADPASGALTAGPAPHYTAVRKDVQQASGKSLDVLVEELEEDFERSGVAFVEYWNPGADLLALRFRILHGVATACRSAAPGLARWAVMGMADIAEWGYRGIRYVPTVE